ncbi:MAG: metal ABC transporter permease [Rhodospirillales bacterium]|nr:metal ABC transporter permease [Rhodospirillales bacterium]
MDDFLWRALAAGVGVAVLSGPLGSFVVWRRLAYFGDTLAHAALLGIAVGVIAGFDVTIGVVAVCAAVAVLLVFLSEERRFSSDTVLGILSHGTLAIGLLAVAAAEGPRVDLAAYLFGDILAVTMGDLVGVYVLGAAVLAALTALWRPLLAVTVHEEVARVEGVSVRAVGIGFMVLMAATVALAMKVVGILLVTALLIVPAAAARRFARTPEAMAVFAAAAGVASVAGGLWAAFAFDMPAGPAIVVAALVLFAVSAGAAAFSSR